VLAVPGYLSFVGGPYPALARLSLKDSASVDGEVPQAPRNVRYAYAQHTNGLGLPVRRADGPA